MRFCGLVTQELYTFGTKLLEGRVKDLVLKLQFFDLELHVLVFAIELVFDKSDLFLLKP